ncbi:CsgE family curli-type amyloid fiber assembly protein [Massilia putida]|uniref:CsgE family curli-type amyloid fiber assembly protein n=1 Tax=Massilia putida TaxID=1141883 RepID=UPI000951B794|nr:CsgE family curli-type amyloid fiber assembly protein [Massilia putida]
MSTPSASVPRLRLSRRTLALTAAALLHCAPLWAGDDAATTRGAGDGIAGILVNQTISAQGLEFYRVFAEAWRDKQDAESHSRTVVERPSRRTGNQIWIVDGQRRVATLALPYRFDRIRAVAEQAADTSYADMIGRLIPSLAVDADLGADEL